MYDIKKILEILPHRYPFLLVDKIEEYSEGEHIVARKNVTINESFFNGHFPGEPVMPGVLIIEAMAQVSGLFVGLSEGKRGIYYLAEVEKARFLKPVKPGDVMIIKAWPKNRKMGIYVFQVEARVENKLVARCTIKAAPSRKE